MTPELPASLGRAWPAPWLRQLLGFTVSLGCVLVLAWRIEWASLLRALSSVSPAPMVAALLIVSACYLLQALRWQWLLGTARPLSYWRAFRVLMVGFAANAMFPLRAGDVLRAVLVRRWLGGGGTRALASVAIERLFDVLAILLFGGVVSFGIDMPAGVRSGVLAVAVTLGVALSGLVAARRFGTAFITMLNRWLSVRSARLTALFIPKLEELVEATDSVAAPARFLAIFAISILQWALVAVAMHVCFMASHLALPFAAAMLFMVVTNLGSAIPSAPASVGVFHGLGVLALSVWKVPASEALAATLAAHAVMVFVQLSFGLPAAWLEGGLLPLRQSARHLTNGRAERERDSRANREK